MPRRENKQIRKNDKQQASDRAVGSHINEQCGSHRVASTLSAEPKTEPDRLATGFHMCRNTPSQSHNGDGVLVMRSYLKPNNLKRIDLFDLHPDTVFV